VTLGLADLDLPNGRHSRYFTQHGKFMTEPTALNSLKLEPYCQAVSDNVAQGVKFLKVLYGGDVR